MGWAVASRACGRAVLGTGHGARVVDSVVDARVGDVDSSPPWARMRWSGNGAGAVRGAAFIAHSRISGGRGHTHARDRVLDFGKNKGSMLGTLSSRYLRWMTKNLRGTMLDEWAEYAQETLDDPLYMDRIEWEKVEKLLVQSHDLAQLSSSRDALAPARIYGWDIDNEHAWSTVNFALLGTTKGGKIPRVPVVKEPKPKARTKRESKPNPPSTRTLKGDSSKWASTPVVDGGGSLREELDRRRQARRERLSAQRDALLAGSKSMKETDSKFPGRGGLLGKLQENHPQK